MGTFVLLLRRLPFTDDGNARAVSSVDTAREPKIMARKPYAYIRAHRRKWALTQVELARLLGLASRSAVSRIERAERVPTTATIIACGIIFGLDASALFPSLYDDIKREIKQAIIEMNDELAAQSDKNAMRKRALLEQILERISSI